MREFLGGVATITAGILVAAALLIAAWYIMRPAQSITVDLGQYVCATDGKTVVRCERK